MGIREQDVLRALRAVEYPGFSRDIVSLGAVQDLQVEDGRVRLRLDPGPGDPSVADALERNVRAALESLEGVGQVTIDRGSPRGQPSSGLRMASAKPSAAAGGALDQGLIPEVRHVVAVASGKGGVGKSTVAVNLAVALQRGGATVGLMDADIYGPSIPLMMGERDRLRMSPDERRLLPFERHGVRFMSLGFMVPPDQAVIWRGPMVMKAVDQLLRDVEWGKLDVLVVDMPPGTGDAQLTLSQRVRLSGALIVTTPQDVALADAIKGVNMFRKVGVPVLGIVENMSFFECPHCNERTEIFGYGGGRREAERLEVPFLGEIPLDPAIRDGGDRGRPIAAEPSSPRSAAFSDLAARVQAALGGEPGAAEGDTAPREGIFARFRNRFGG